MTGTVQTDHGAVPVVYTGIDIFRVEDGKLTELWQNTDDAEPPGRPRAGPVPENVPGS